MSGLFSAAWAIEALIASTLLMGFVLIVRKPAQRALGTQLAYWLWALPVLRMITPPLPTGWREHAVAPISAASETVMVFIAPATTTIAADPATAPFPWLALIAGAWVLGALAFFVWHGLAHFAYVRRIVSPPARLERMADGTMLVESDEAIGPVAFGVLKRFVAVPRDFAERYDEDERRLAMAHELGHHARGDLIANWIALGVLAVHWFNPIAWFAYRKFRTDQELANDARVLAALPPVERHAYACAILKAANGRAITAACHLHTIEDLKGRLRMLKASRKSRRVLLAGATGIMGLTVAGLGLTASGAAAEQIRTVTTTQVTAMAQAAAEAAPAPPPAIPATEPAPPAPYKQVVIVRNGKTETYSGPEADAYIATHPGVRQVDPAKAGRHRIVISKNGKTETYEGADADAYLKAHPEMRPPLPPVPPAGVSPPSPPSISFVTTRDGKTMFRRTGRTGSGDRAYAFVSPPEVVHGDCGDRDKGAFVVSEKRKDGTPRMIVCEKRINLFAASQAEMAEKMAGLHRNMGLSQALRGLETGRDAITGNRNLTDEQRQQALSGIDSARVEIERQIREGEGDK